jgi:phage host-nuclease inhibitor protein Gam
MLRKMAARRRRLRGLESEMQAEMDAVASRHAGRIQTCAQALQQLESRLRDFCVRHRAGMLPAGRKSLHTPSGTVGFRAGAVSVSLRDGLAARDACRLLAQHGLDRLVRVRTEPDRSAIKKAWQEGRVPHERLAACGIVLARAEDELYVRLDERSASAASQTDAGR